MANGAMARHEEPQRIGRLVDQNANPMDPLLLGKEQTRLMPSFQ